MGKSGSGCLGVLAGLLLFLVIPLSWARCIHDAMQSEVTVLQARVLLDSMVRLPSRATQHSQPLFPAFRNTRALAPHPLLPIRIKTVFRTAESAPMSKELAVQLEAAVAEAVLTISQALAVQPVIGHLLLRRDPEWFCRSVWRDPASDNYNKCGFADHTYHAESCLGVTIPDEHLEGYSVWPEHGDIPREVIKEDGDGIAGADFILYVKVANTAKCHNEPTVIAYASYCQQDDTGRPVAGAIIFCPAHLVEAITQHENVVQVTLHELLHALGFSRNLFEKWKDCSYAPAIGVNCSSRARVTNTDEAGQMRIFTPAVMEKMKEHLGEGETGAPLENQDTIDLPSSHWEARVLQGSIMTASIPDARLTHLDEVTLAAFADTGWYQVNGSAGTKLIWGQGEGTSFGLTTTCKDNSSKYFCTGSGSGCHYLHLHKGHCSTDPFLDGCRMYKPLNNGSECWIEGNQVHVPPRNHFGEVHHMDSRCFFSTLTKEVHAKEGTAPAAETVHGCCYLHRCVTGDQYEVKVAGSVWLSCPSGTSIQVPGYRGVLFCPDALFCHNATRSAYYQPTAGLTSTASISSDSMSRTSGPAIQKTRDFILQGHLVVTEARPHIPDAEHSLLATMVVRIMANFTGIDSCHFKRLMLEPSLSFAVEIWHSASCPDSSVGSLYQRLQGAIDTIQMPFMFNGTSFALVLMRILNSTLETPSPPPVSHGHLPALIICLGLATILLLTAGTIIYRNQRNAARVQDAFQLPADITKLATRGSKRIVKVYAAISPEEVAVMPCFKSAINVK